jgi:CcmD family protein
MDEIYTTVVPSLPYVIGAYGLIWVTLVVYVGLVMRRVARLEQQVAVVEESLGRKA